MTRMKESGIDWIGQIPEEWEVKGIKHIFEEIGSGTTPQSDNETFYDGDINWIQSGDLYQTDEVIKVSKTITYQGFQSTSALKIYQQPFIALAMYGASVGNVAISCIDACVNQAVVVMLGTSEKVRFGKYAIEASKNNLIFSAQGGTQPNISQNLIKNWNIPQPDSSEQTKIADFLDKKTAQLDKVKALLEEQIQKLKDYRASLIYETVTKGLDKTVPVKDSGIDWIGQVPQGWEISKIRYLVTTRSEKRITDSSIPYIGLENIESQTGKFVETGIQVDKSENIVVEIGDVLFGKLRPYLRKYWRATFPSTASSEFLVFQSSELDMNFLYYAIQSDSFIEEVNTSTYGSKMPRASWEYIKNMKITFPSSLVEQQKIANLLDEKTAQIDNLIQIKNQQIKNINKQRQTLIYDYVTGKRRV